ncbi:MAG: hypothetical protein WC988_03960 [Patescibacteria group bacterium]
MTRIKSQKIIPNLPPELPALSFVITSQDDSEHVKEWDFFAVFDFEGRTPVNTQVSINVIKDLFTHEVVEGLEVGPVLQTLEKTLKECRDAVQKLTSDAKFNAVVAVFKDEYAYISIYGNSKALYLDGTQVVHVDTGKEGNYAGGSQKIEEGKVMILCTERFFNKFPPKSLISLTKPILGGDLEELSSAVILKVDTPVVVTKPAVQVVTANFNDKTNTVVGSVKATSNGKSVDREAPRFVKPLVILLAVLLTVAVGYIAMKQFVLKPKAPSKAVVVENNVVDTLPKPPEVQGELTKKLDEANKVKRVSAQVFYDISITDAKANPSELALGANYIAVCDTVQGKIYISTKSITKFEELPQLFPGVKNLLFEGDGLIFTDNEGVKFYSLATKSVTKSYLADTNYPTIGPSSEYLGFTYALSGDKLVKFLKIGNKLSGALWMQKPGFAGGISVDIDGSIYVLFSNGNLEKYTAGAKDDFSIVGLDKPIQKPLKVVTNADYKQIYVGDGAEGRLIAFDTDGVLDFQIKPQLGNEWSDLKSFDISSNEKTSYVLSGTKVFEFSL